MRRSLWEDLSLSAGVFFWRTLERHGERIRAVEFICGCEPAWVMGALLQASTRLNLNGSHVLSGSTATHDPTPVKSLVDEAGDSLDETRENPKMKGMII